MSNRPRMSNSTTQSWSRQRRSRQRDRLQLISRPIAIGVRDGRSTAVARAHLTAVCAILSDTVGTPNTRIAPGLLWDRHCLYRRRKVAAGTHPDSKACTGWRRASSRTARSSPRRSPRLPDWLSRQPGFPNQRLGNVVRFAGHAGIFPVARLISCLPDDAVPSLPRHYSGLDATFDGPVLLAALRLLSASLLGLGPFAGNFPLKVPAVQRARA